MKCNRLKNRALPFRFGPVDQSSPERTSPVSKLPSREFPAVFQASFSIFSRREKKCRGDRSSCDRGPRSSRGCVLYRKTLSEIYGEIIRDGVSESNRPLFSAPSIMLISIAARLMEEGGVPLVCARLSEPRRRRPDVPSAFARPCIMHWTCNYCELR